jgi:hypothetical protein
MLSSDWRRHVPKETKDLVQSSHLSKSEFKPLRCADMSRSLDRKGLSPQRTSILNHSTETVNGPMGDI